MANGISDRAERFRRLRGTSNVVSEDQNRNININIPRSSAAVSKINKYGPTAEVFNPAQAIAEKSVEPTFNTIEGLAMAMKLFNTADRLIPAKDDPSEAVLAGVGRNFGTTDIGRLIGMGNEDALAFKRFRQAFGTLLARAFGERGVVTNQDVSRVLSAFPQFNDSTQVRNESRQFIKNFLLDKIKRFNNISRIARQGGGQMNLSETEPIRIEGPQ